MSENSKIEEIVRRVIKEEIVLNYADKLLTEKIGGNMKEFIILLNFIFVFSILGAQTLTGNVSYVSDGDTIHTVANNQKYKIRFYGIEKEN